MAEYIDRTSLINNLKTFAPEHYTALINDLILKEPAADVVEVVRCKDCKWCHAGYCEKYDDLIPFGCANKPWDDWFCADGEKKNG